MLPIVWIFSQNQSSTSNNSALLNAVGIAFVLGCAWFVRYAPEWFYYPSPYDFVLGFYYYTVYVPVVFVTQVFHWFASLTEFRNLNFVMGVFGCVGYLVAFFGLAHIIGRKCQQIKYGLFTLSMISFGPVVFAALFGLISWLFT